MGECRLVGRLFEKSARARTSASGSEGRCRKPSGAAPTHAHLPLPHTITPHLPFAPTYTHLNALAVSELIARPIDWIGTRPASNPLINLPNTQLFFNDYCYLH